MASLLRYMLYFLCIFAGTCFAIFKFITERTHKKQFDTYQFHASVTPLGTLNLPIPCATHRKNRKEYKGRTNCAHSALARLLWLLYRPGSTQRPHMYPTPGRVWGMGVVGGCARVLLNTDAVFAP